MGARTLAERDSSNGATKCTPKGYSCGPPPAHMSRQCELPHVHFSILQTSYDLRQGPRVADPAPQGAGEAGDMPSTGPCLPHPDVAARVLLVTMLGGLDRRQVDDSKQAPVNCGPYLGNDVIGLIEG